MPATLIANEGKIIKTVTIRSFINSLFRSEALASLSEDVSIDRIPKIPKAIEAPINSRVDIFCIPVVYQAARYPSTATSKPPYAIFFISVGISKSV